jgi:hypothetical protein
MFEVTDVKTFAGPTVVNYDLARVGFEVGHDTENN